MCKYHLPVKQSKPWQRDRREMGRAGGYCAITKTCAITGSAPSIKIIGSILKKTGHGHFATNKDVAGN